MCIKRKTLRLLTGVVVLLGDDVVGTWDFK